LWCAGFSSFARNSDETISRSPRHRPEAIHHHDLRNPIEGLKQEVANDSTPSSLFSPVGRRHETETPKARLVLCGAGLFVSLLFATYGLDLSPGFFLMGHQALTR